VAGGVARQPEQAQVIAAVGADIAALQEVTATALSMWRVALADAGLVACETALDLGAAGIGRKVLVVLTAAREPLADNWRYRQSSRCAPWERVGRWSAGCSRR
jgi:hypothetical protein